MKNLLLISLFFLLTAVDCEKKKQKNAEEFSGEITLQTPFDGDTLHGSPITLQASATANEELHGWYVVVYNNETLDVLYENQAHVHDGTLAINETFSPVLTDTTLLQIHYEFANDDAGSNNLKKTIYCTWVP